MRKRVVISGLVQGVFFRDTCRREASRYGVAGWIRNRPDGAVEAVFEGEDGPVDRMVKWAGRGPSKAIITQVRVHPEQPEGIYGFTVRN